MSRVLVFARTKHHANRVAEQLGKGGVAAEAIHGNKSQGARQRALKRFRDGQARVLVATDIVARGIDVDSVSHVINYETPQRAGKLCPSNRADSACRCGRCGDCLLRSERAGLSERYRKADQVPADGDW